MSSHYKDSCFIKLKRSWYEKLKDSGFLDIEHECGNLRRFDSSWTTYLPHSIRSFQIQQDYYYYAAHFLYDYKFQDPIEQSIWSLHCGGMSIRRIPSELRGTFGNSVHKESVSKRMRSLKQTFFSYLKTL